MKYNFFQLISKKRNIKYLFSVIIFYFSALYLFSQDCTGYHQYHCIYGDYTFFYSRQSKSALFEKGQTSELKITVYGGEDYYIAICAHRKFGDLQFRLLEDNDARTVIYNNAEDDYNKSVTFTNETTRNLIVEVTVPEGSENERNERRCVGVVIEFRKTGSVNRDRDIQEF